MTGAESGRHRPRAPGRVAVRALAAVLALASLASAWVVWRNHDRPLPETAGIDGSASPAQDPAQRGAYLARAAQCLGCHTAAGGEPYAGGRPVATPFGTVYSSNLTPDPVHGLGRWSADDFERAVRHGRSRDGRLLTAAFPFADFARLARADVDALFDHLRAQPAVARPNRAHELRWPYGTQLAQAVWRALYLNPQPLLPRADRDEAWHRGRYLAEAVAHCQACHTSRDRFGGRRSDDGGGTVSARQWRAPSLLDSRQAGLSAWSEDEVVALLQTGVSPRGSALGPMADVVFRGTQHLTPQDLRAMARYLRSLPSQDRPVARAPAAGSETLAEGRRIYDQHCADCHGRDGQGEPGATAPLAGNRAVTMDDPRNVILVLRHGGFTPTTAGQPRPWGMPPFAGILSPGEMAAVATYLRQSWGHAAAEVTTLDVLRTP